MGRYNLLHDVEVICPRCGVRAPMEAQIYVGPLQWVSYRLGDRLTWDASAYARPAEPLDGDEDGEGYIDCPLCRRDFFIRVHVRAGVVRSVSVDPTRAGYVPDDRVRDLRPWPEGRARVWLGVLPSLALAADSPAWLPFPRPARYAAIEVAIHTGPRFVTGLLGCGFVPVPAGVGDSQLHIDLLPTDRPGPAVAWALVGANDEVQLGLPAEYAPGVRAGAAGAEAVLGPGVLRFGAAAHGLVGSSERLFAALAAGLIPLVAYPQPARRGTDPTDAELEASLRTVFLERYFD